MRLEFKEVCDSKKNPRYLKTLAAFSNNRGGALVFDVSNNPRTIVGVDASTVPDVADWQNRFGSYFDPAINIEVHEFKVKRKNVVVVSVPQGERRPYICLKNATETVLRHNKTFDQSVLQTGAIYFRYAGSNLPIRPSDLREIIRDRVDKDVTALSAEQISTQRAELKFVGLRSTNDANSQITNWQIVIRNNGPGEAKNVRMRLLSIDPPAPIQAASAN
jgi:predicted HTH transcriptional regulator